MKGSKYKAEQIPPKWNKEIEMEKKKIKTLKIIQEVQFMSHGNSTEKEWRRNYQRSIIRKFPWAETLKSPEREKGLPTSLVQCVNVWQEDPHKTGHNESPEYQV